MWMCNVREVWLRHREAPWRQVAMWEQEAADRYGQRLAVGYGPVGVGEGGRRRLGLRAPATESRSGSAGRVVHALSSALCQGTHPGEAGHRSRA